MYQVRREMEARDAEQSAAAAETAKTAVAAPQFEIDETQSMEQAGDMARIEPGKDKGTSRRLAEKKAMPRATETEAGSAPSEETVSDVPIETES